MIRCQVAPRNETPSGNEEPFSRLLVAYRQQIYGFILALVHDRTVASDILQEASIVLWRKFDSFEPGTDFGAWAMAVARLSVCEWRRRERHPPLQLDDKELALLADDAASVSSEYEARQEALRACMQRLSQADQDLIVSRYYAGKSVSSLAQLAGRTRMSVYKRLNKLHGLLLDCINRHLAREER